jgi:hypothetical protein
MIELKNARKMFLDKPERRAKFGGSDLKHSFLCSCLLRQIFPLLYTIQPPHLISPRDPYVSQHFPLPSHSLLEAGNFSGCRNISMNPARDAAETL